MKIIEQSKAQGFLGDLLDNMDEQTLSRAEKRMSIALKIGDALRKKGVSQKEFAQRMRKSTSEVCDWLSGDRNFTVDTLTDISDALGINLLDTEIETSYYIPSSSNMKVRTGTKYMSYKGHVCIGNTNEHSALFSNLFA